MSHLSLGLKKRHTITLITDNGLPVLWNMDLGSSLSLVSSLSATDMA